MPESPESALNSPVPAISFNDVSKTFVTKNGTIPALSSLQLQVRQGQIYGFAGPNGAGKSTSLKILMGLTEPDSGTVEVMGHRAGSREAKRLLGFLPEVTLYHEFMGALELLDVHAILAGVAKKERKAKCEEALAKVGLSERRNSRLKEFSKGMKQRFGIAQAIVGDPAVLVLDELTSGLDPQAQASLLELLQDLKDLGLTIFFSSHHLQEIEKVCDSVAIIHKGVLRASGSLDRVLGSEESVWVKVRFKDDAPPADSDVVWTKEVDGSFSAQLVVDGSLEYLKSLQPKLHSIHTLETRRQSLQELFLKLTSQEEKVTA